MEERNKTYGFTISVYEIKASIPTLWTHVKGKDPQLVTALTIDIFLEFEVELP